MPIALKDARNNDKSKHDDYDSQVAERCDDRSVVETRNDQDTIIPDYYPKSVSESSSLRNEHSLEHCLRSNRSSASSVDSGGETVRLFSPRQITGPFSRQATVDSSLLGGSMIEVDDLQNDSERTSALLGYCERKFLRPFVTILALIGLNPISTDTSICRVTFSYFHALLVLGLLLSGYFLQYLCAYRGDRGLANHYEESYQHFRVNASHAVGELVFGHIIPNALHLCGFISAVIVFKILDQEQLQNLIERVFLSSMKPRRLCRVLWLYIMFGVVVLCLLFAYALPAVVMHTQIVQETWTAEIPADWQLTMKITLLITTFLQDLVEITILTSYCIECHLLHAHLATLSQKLLMHSIETLDWMREVLEFRKLLNHLNQCIAIPVCFFTIMNLTYAFAGLIYIFKNFDFYISTLKGVYIDIADVLLRLWLGLVPFFFAASVTHVCKTAQATGHQIRVRPFVYHNTSADDLNSTLLFASSLDMSAKLFSMPVQYNYLCFTLVAVSLIVMTFDAVGTNSPERALQKAFQVVKKRHIRMVSQKKAAN